MTARDVRAVIERHAIAPPRQDAPIVRAVAGARLRDEQGGVWIDACTGGFGNGDPDVQRAVAAQLERIALSSRFLISRPLAEAVAAIDRFCVGDLTISYPCSSGSEALDAALKLAKGTHPRRRKVVAVRGEEHGTLSHGQALGGRPSPLPSLSLRPVSAALSDPDRFLTLVDRDTAAVVIAPAAPGRALAQLPSDWWAALRRRCDRTRTLLVVDERQTAPARTGSGLAVEQLGIVPDVVVLGDAFGADAIPLGITVMTRRAYDRVYSRRNPSLHGSTFGANPLAAATATAVIGASDAALADRQTAVGRAARERLRTLISPDGALREHGADGSLIWLRAASPAGARRLAAELAAERVLVRAPSSDVVGLLPPLTARAADIEAMLARTVTAAARLKIADGMPA
jgi:acetylornithine/succinyldiaminopimelate/putrescine aminotransferase